ncbi:MAG: restriction endonuclease subunit S [Bacteroidota bacterium]
MNKQNQNIPQLRFPEFYREWETSRLGEVSTINPTTNKLPEKFIYIDLESVDNGELTKEVVVLKNEAPSRAQRVVEKDDILFQMVRPYQKNNLYFDRDGDYVASTGYAQIKSKQSARYIYQYLHLQKFVDEVIERCTGTSYPAINSKDLAKICICYPTLPEQQKIASFFTAIDQKITQLKQKKDLLEHYKKGVMQKIFNQQIRFKDDKRQEFPKWEKKKIKDLVEIKYGKDQKQILCENGKYPILGTGGEMGRTNDFHTDKPSVLIGRKGTIDKPRYMDTPFWTVDTLFYTNVFANTNPKWLYYKFGTINWYLYNEASGVPSLSSSTIYIIPINLPTLPEQTKIANFLSAIDDKINHTQMQIEKAELWKKGLLQKMFV